MLDTIPKFNASVKLLRQLRLTSWRLDHCFQRLDSAQHALFTQAAAELKARYPAYGSVADADPSFFHGRSLIFNRATPEHTDRKDMKLAWTPLITVGPYTEGTLHIVALDVASESSIKQSVGVVKKLLGEDVGLDYLYRS